MCKKLSNDEVFDLFDMNKDGVVDEAEFVLFFEQADKGIKLPSTAELDAEEERGESAKPAEETAESVGGNGEDDAAEEKPHEPRESKEAPVGEDVPERISHVTSTLAFWSSDRGRQATDVVTATECWSSQQLSVDVSRIPRAYTDEEHFSLLVLSSFVRVLGGCVMGLVATWNLESLA